jgi:hypothetical protein
LADGVGHLRVIGIRVDSVKRREEKVTEETSMLVLLGNLLRDFEDLHECSLLNLFLRKKERLDHILEDVCLNKLLWQHSSERFESKAPYLLQLLVGVAGGLDLLIFTRVERGLFGYIVAAFQ